LDTSILNFKANVDGSIICEIVDSNGIAQDLNGCYIKFNLGYEYDDSAIISEDMTVYEINKCLVNLTPEQTEVLSKGEYEFNLVIIDGGNKKHVTDKVKISIDRIIE